MKNGKCDVGDLRGVFQFTPLPNTPLRVLHLFNMHTAICCEAHNQEVHGQKP